MRTEYLFRARRSRSGGWSAVKTGVVGKAMSWLHPVLLAMLLSMMAAAADAEAACTGWDVTRPISFEQSNGIGVDLAMSLHGNILEGRALQTFVPRHGPGLLGDLGTVGSDPESLAGIVDGAVSGSSLSLKIVWNDGSIGIYDLQVDENRQLSGETYDFHHPSSRARIVGFDPISCADFTAAPPKPAHRLGKVLTHSSDAVCRSGFVWREARPADTVCVVPATRAETREENRLAGSRHVADGRNCLAGFVWREAYPNDIVCVPPSSRSRAQLDNESAFLRTTAAISLLPIVRMHTLPVAAPATDSPAAPTPPPAGDADTSVPSTPGSQPPPAPVQAVPVIEDGVVVCQPSMVNGEPQVPATVGGRFTCQPSAEVSPVWVNEKTRVYHCKGDSQYGKTKSGTYMSESDAVTQGYRAANGRACE